MDKFARFVARDDKGCWLWQGSMQSNGYGRLPARPRPIAAHRLAWTLFRGDIPDGLAVDHLCRNRQCANPFHLRLVTPTVNALENSDSVCAINAKKTHCKRGHPFDDQNTYWIATGGRACKTCMAANVRSYRARQRAIA